MNLKLTAIPILALVISLSTIGFVNAESNDTNATTSGPAGSCSQDDITAAKQGLADIQQKMVDLRKQYYTDWQDAHNSGQYNGTFQQYSHEKISSSDLSQIKSDYQKYSSVLKNCGITGPMMKPHAPNTICSQGNISSAKQDLVTSSEHGMDLRNKIYQQFKTDQASGKFNGTWVQYAKENFYNLPEILQLKSTHDKFSNFLKNCFGNKVTPVMPQNQGENSTGTIWQNGTQSLPPISSPIDALNTMSFHGIPGWVKGVAGWWAQGKISDDEFVSAIKFLAHQGIIKV